MNDISQAILNNAQPIGILGLVGLCLYLVKMANGKSQGKVGRKECHEAQESIRDKIDTLDNHLSERFTDLKDFMIKNGVKK